MAAAQREIVDAQHTGDTDLGGTPNAG
jgi:hypothetical protein